MDVVYALKRRGAPLRPSAACVGHTGPLPAVRVGIAERNVYGRRSDGSVFLPDRRTSRNEQSLIASLATRRSTMERVAVYREGHDGAERLKLKIN
ncbi:hypothetical protein EVAR_52556_1 [Eumeta japonica]|uniref:Uncharacterized protein n=1 Tax=Eumeta variegata TaxID=151549 RepID=A0A4C1ZLX8_EUMVA|nr:hypothetical protein EVAR_52556_1 [Eumeta japonica]